MTFACFFPGKGDFGYIFNIIYIGSDLKARTHRRAALVW